MKRSNPKTDHVTVSMFEKSMRSIANSFDKVFEKFERQDKVLDQHSKVFGSILTEIQKQSQEAREHRMMMSTLNQTDISQQRKIQGLELRIEKLEMKAK